MFIPPCSVLSRRQSLEQVFRALCILVEHSRLDLRRQEVVGLSHGVEIAGQVEVKRVHGDDL